MPVGRPPAPSAARRALLLTLAGAQALLCAVPAPLAMFAGRVPVRPEVTASQGPVEEQQHGPGADETPRAARVVVAAGPRWAEAVSAAPVAARPPVARRGSGAAERRAAPPARLHGTAPVPLRC